MACYHPIPAYQDEGVKLWPPVGHANVNLPCGNCVGCRQDRATAWARRAEHEARCWPVNIFLTLTYRDKDLPPYGHLVPSHLTKFLKRLRAARTYMHRSMAWRTGPHLGRGSRVRYLACGEYGESLGRPHYHLCLFNVGFRDAYAVGKDLYSSPTLAELWKYGDHKFGEVTGASANYVAQYTLKKVGVPSEVEHTEGVIKPPAFMRASTRPMLGMKFLREFREDLRHGYLVSNGKRGAIPRSYKRKLAEYYPELAEESAEGALRYRRPQVDLRAAEFIHEQRVAAASRT